MATSVKDSREENESVNARNPVLGERASTMSTNEGEQQDGLEDTTLQKPQLSEPCISTMENYLLVHFFFIFAASFILGVIFLHSSLSFWSWQVYDDVPPFSTEQTADIQDSFSYHQGYEQSYRKGFVPHQEVLKAVINPNMTVSLTR